MTTEYKIGSKPVEGLKVVGTIKSSDPRDSRVHVEMTPAMLEKIVRLLESHYFECPRCGSTWFTRDMNETGILSTCRCGDSFGRGCNWQGIWPMEETK